MALINETENERNLCHSYSYELDKDSNNHTKYFEHMAGSSMRSLRARAPIWARAARCKKNIERKFAVL